MLNLEHSSQDNDFLNDAFIQRSYGPQQLKTYDDNFGDLYVYGQEYGPQLLIRAESWESAYSIAIDESKPIDHDDIIQAYGFYIFEHNDIFMLASDVDNIGVKTYFEGIPCSHQIIGTFKTYQLANDYCLNDVIAKRELDLIEGYQYQDNSTGTGIVNNGHYEWLNSLHQYNSQYDDTITPVFTED